MTLRSCLKSMRFRTLPLSLSGTVFGVALASTAGNIKWYVVLTLVFTTVLLQILSNLSNELGDTLHGTDTEQRQGIHYSLQDGDMTVAQMKRLIAVIACLCCVSGLLMILLSFKRLFAFLPMLFIALGAAAIWAAMRYTLGKNPYGYRGLGDLFVFIFFGLVSALGAAFICVHTIEPLWILPASAVGCFSIGVLNVNNLRDMSTDAATRTTVAIKLGAHRARIYQTALISAGWVLLLAFTALTGVSADSLLYVLTVPLFVLHLRGVWKLDRSRLDPMLPLLVMGTFATALLFMVGIVLR